MDKERYEIIVVDDASSDGSKNVIKSFPRVKAVFLKKRHGVSYASNVGIKTAAGLFIIRVDADDFINENTAQFMTELLLANPGIGFIYCDYFKVDEVGNKLERIHMRSMDNLLNHGAGVMFRKLNLETLGLYDIKMKQCEDMDLLVRYFKNFDGYHLSIPLYRYTQHDNNMTRNKKERKEWERRVSKLRRISLENPKK